MSNNEKINNDIQERENKIILNDNKNSNQNSTTRNQLNEKDEEVEGHISVDNLNSKGNNIGLKIDNFAENNITIRNIIDNALFQQLSEINVKLLNFDQSLSERLYKNEGKMLPKIDFIDFTLLNQGVSISKFQKYGFGLYVFFLYLINLLVIFGVLFIFALHYMYCIFYKYYRDYEDYYSFFFDY